MFAPGAGGTPALVLCDGSASAPAVAAPAHAMHGMHSAPRHDPAQHRQAPCPYAALAAPVLPPLTTALVPQTPIHVARPLPPILGRAAPGAAAPPPPATGPPQAA
jgi:hypothetical protein